MKKLSKMMMLLILLLFVLAGSVMASGDEYILTRNYSYEYNDKNKSNKEAFVKILIGSGDFVKYQNDEYITVSPSPDEIKEDKYGNKYAYYDLSGIKIGTKINITVKRKVKLDNYIEMIPTRTNTEQLDENAIYLIPQEQIDSDNEEIISKAKELTEDIPSDYKKAQAIFEYINLNMTYDNSKIYANKGSISALKNMKGVCEEYVTLFVAMCRAIGIPSRVITGYSLQFEEVSRSGEKVQEKVLINHAWAEIYLQDFGWVPVDPTSMVISESGRVANLNAFCKMNPIDSKYITVGIYNYDDENADRVMRSVEEILYEEKIMEIEEVVENKNKFEDISNYEWAKDAIQSLYQIGVAKGYSETEYGPQTNISRIEFISMLSRVLKYKETNWESKGLVYYYLDYNQKHWSKEDYDYLMRCYQAITPSDIASAGYYNIADVFDDGKIEIDRPITRAEVVALMDVFLPDNVNNTKLTDIHGKKFERSIVKAYNYGLIIGYPDLSFRPDNNITRAEMAVVLERYIGNEMSNIL